MRTDLFSSNFEGSASISRSGSLALMLTLLSTLVSGCGSDTLPKPQKLGPLRVLGLIASTPEVAATGATVNIIPVISDTDGGTRILNYEWKSCLDPGIALGATPTCEGQTAITAPNSNTINRTSTQLANYPFTGSATNDSYSVVIPGNLLTTKSAFEKFNGISVLITFRLSVDGSSESTTAFRRILVRDTTLNPTPLNSKPGAPSGITALPATETDLTPTLTESAQSYSVLSTTGAVLSRTEKLTVSWFTTDGEFEFSRTDGASANKWTPPSSGSPVGLLLLRDDRGGLSDPLTIGF
jgi:hypothetical protein